MTLLKTALKNLKKNPVMNVICLVQLIAVFLITAVMISTMCIRYRTYTPLKDILESNGFYTAFDIFLFGALKPNGDPNLDAVFSTDELLEYVNADRALVIREQHMYYKEFEALGEMLFYDRELIERYTPELKRGRWISPDADELEIVISEGTFGFDVGDEAEVRFSQYHKDAVPVKVRVVGVLDDNAGVFVDFNRGQRNPTDTYRCFYRPRDELTEQVVLASTDAIQRLYPEANELYIRSAFLLYDDITDEELMQEINTAGKMSGRIMADLNNLNRNSREYLKNELLKLLPIVVILLILVIISSVSVSAISARRRLRDYAKYYMLGLQWRQCALVNLFQTLTVGAAALAISCAGLVIVGATGLSDMFMVIWNVPLVLALLGVLTLYLVFSMIMPLLMLRSSSPKALLQTE